MTSTSGPSNSHGCELRPVLTGARRLLALLSLASLALAVLAAQLGRGGVAEADPGDDARAASHRAGGPGRPVAPAAVLLDWGVTERRGQRSGRRLF